MKKNSFIKDLIECIIIGLGLSLIVILGILQYKNPCWPGQTNGTLLNKINKQSKLCNKVNKLLVEEKETKIKLEQTIKQINVMIVNQTEGTLGSGVSIKYKGKFYILSAGHMASTEEPNEIYLHENGREICKLKIVKHLYTETNDLLLLKPINPRIVPRFYTEIAENEPITGTQIYICGNPMGIEDVISDGRIIIYKNNYMYYIDHTYFGNSGGGIYTYDGKLVGIVSHMINLKPTWGAPDYIINGAVRLDTILEFMEGIR